MDDPMKTGMDETEETEEIEETEVSSRDASGEQTEPTPPEPAPGEGTGEVSGGETKSEPAPDPPQVSKEDGGHPTSKRFLPPDAKRRSAFYANVLPQSSRDKVWIYAVLMILGGLGAQGAALVLWARSGTYYGVCTFLSILAALLAAGGAFSWLMRIPTPSGVALVGVLGLLFMAFRYALSFPVWLALIFGLILAGLNFSHTQKIKFQFQTYERTGVLPDPGRFNPDGTRAKRILSVLCALLVLADLVLLVVCVVPGRDRFTPGEYDLEKRTYTNDYAGIHTVFPDDWELIYEGERLDIVNQLYFGPMRDPSRISVLLLAYDKEDSEERQMDVSVQYERSSLSLKEFTDRYLDDQLVYGTGTPTMLDRSDVRPETGKEPRPILYCRIYDKQEDTSRLRYVFFVQGVRKGEYLRIEVHAPDESRALWILSWLGLD